MYRERAQGFNTQPPEGGCITSSNFATIATSVSTHSRPKAAAILGGFVRDPVTGFQHTAARRRLLNAQHGFDEDEEVSTHSRPKAAAL